jgi:hypothetical protein
MVTTYRTITFCYWLEEPQPSVRSTTSIEPQESLLTPLRLLGCCFPRTTSLHNKPRLGNGYWHSPRLRIPLQEQQLGSHLLCTLIAHQAQAFDVWSAVYSPSPVESCPWSRQRGRDHPVQESPVTTSPI